MVALGILCMALIVFACVRIGKSDKAKKKLDELILNSRVTSIDELAAHVQLPYEKVLKMLESRVSGGQSRVSYHSGEICRPLNPR